MVRDWFQETSSDFFQTDFLPGRAIPERDLLEVQEFVSLQNDAVYQKRYTRDDRNTSPWITAIYRSQYHAQKASLALPLFGLNIYYPRTRFKEKEIFADWEMKNRKRAQEGKSGERFVSAYGRYLFIQLPEDQETFENLEIPETLLAGRANENGLLNVIYCDGELSLTRHDEIVRNREFHERHNEKSNPKLELRFAEGEVVKIASGNLSGRFAKVASDVFMSYKLKSKIEVLLGKSGARHFVKIGSLEKALDKHGRPLDSESVLGF